MNIHRTFLSLVALVAACFSARAQALSENFAQPFNPAASGWIVTNNSGPTPGSVSWAQGNQTGGNSTITAFYGLDNDYYMADFLSVSSQGTISAWLITPTVTIYNGAVLEFATATKSTSPVYPDRLQVRMAQNTVAAIPAGVGSVGSFTTTLLDINPNLTTNYATAVSNGSVNGYPASWTVYQLVVSGVTGTVSGRFAFRYYVNNGGLNGANSRMVGIDAVRYTLPCEPAVADNYTNCAGSESTLTAFGVPANTYSWSTGSTASSIVVSPTATTVYTLFPVNNGSACPTPITRTITVGPFMDLDISASATTICEGTSVLLSVSGPVDPANFLWNYIGGTMVTTTVGPTATVTPAGTMTFQVAASALPCFGLDSIVVNVLPRPNLSVNINPSPVCLGGTFTVTGSGAALYAYLGSTVNPQTLASPTAAGSYSFTMLGTGANGCVASRQVTLNAYAPPAVSIVASSTAVCANQTISMSASGADTYTWTSNASFAGNPASFTYSSASTGLKTFTVVGTSTLSGCKASAVKSISVSACDGTGIQDPTGKAIGAVVFPNPFSSELRVSALTGRVEIYNALGQLVITAEVSENLVISTAELSKGVYLVKALDRDGREVTTQRLLKN